MTNPNLAKQTNELRASDPDLLEESLPNSNGTNAYDGQANCKAGLNFVPLTMGGDGRTHRVSHGSASLMDEVSLDDLTKMTERFYDKAFQDKTIDKFIRSHDEPHGHRFAKWIHTKLSGSNVWDQDRADRSKEPVVVAGGRHHIVHDRSSAHIAAWYSPKRPKHEVGCHFKLDECRVWMRLHFWAMRESGMLEKSPSFADYYVRFIGHFVRVYESAAPMFARDSFRWSANPANIEAYLANGRLMGGVLNLSLEEAEAQLPDSEVNDFEWPYTAEPTPTDVISGICMTRDK